MINIMYSLSSLFVICTPYSLTIINRPGVAGAVPQRALSLINILINCFNKSWFLKNSSEHLYFQTVRARGAEILREGSPPPTCHLSHVTCLVSHVTYNLKILNCVYIFGQSGETTRWRAN